MKARPFLIYTDSTHTTTMPVERGQYFRNGDQTVRVVRVNAATVSVVSRWTFGSLMRVGRGSFLVLFTPCPAPEKEIEFPVRQNWK